MTSFQQELRILCKLAAPVVATQFGSMLLGVVDTLMVGRVSVESLAAAGLGNVWTGVTLMFGMGIVLGMDPIVSQSHGAGDHRQVGIALQRGIVIAVMVAIPVAGSWLLTRSLLLWSGQDAVTAELAHRYVLVQIPSIPCFLVFIAIRHYLQGRGIVYPAMWVMVIANVLNVVFNWALIFGHWGFPALGLFGAGVASALTRSVLLFGLAGWVVLLRLHQDAWLPWGRHSFSAKGLFQVFALGFPTGIQYGLEVFAFAASTLMAGRLGVMHLASHNIVLNMASLSFMIPLGVSIGSAVRVGQLIGSGDRAGARQSAWIAISLGAVLMLVSASVFILLRHQIPGWYSPDIAVIQAASLILPIAASFQIFDGVQVVGGGVLRGMGRPRVAAMFNLVGYYVLALPIGGYLAFNRGYGLSGIWWGMSFGLAVIAALLLFWIRLRGPDAVDRIQVA